MTRSQPVLAAANTTAWRRINRPCPWQSADRHDGLKPGGTPLVAAHIKPTVRRRRLGAELRRLRLARGLKSAEVAERLMVSQPKISHLENGCRTISRRDVRELCAVYGVTDPQVIDALLQMAKESGQPASEGAAAPSAPHLRPSRSAAPVAAVSPTSVPGARRPPARESSVPDLFTRPGGRPAPPGGSYSAGPRRAAVACDTSS
ncbi:helix-turn-helix domain-containing protein, partial [Streptomyces sviceus]|uniref:helix-turn-helix domain-containing protein n=1 Tax=Streptomyces sviceus TaxID=285530 RepID=UPI0036EA0353